MVSNNTSTILDLLRKGRRVCLFECSTVSIPDTGENRHEYPLAYKQTPRTNFAIARIGVLITLSCCAILVLGIGRYAGKGQGEVSILRSWDTLRHGDAAWGSPDVGLGGRYLLKERGVDTVRRLLAHRRADFRRSTRLGKDDHSCDGRSRHRFGRGTGRPTKRLSR